MTKPERPSPCAEAIHLVEPATEPVPLGDSRTWSNEWLALCKTAALYGRRSGGMPRMHGTRGRTGA